MEQPNNRELNDAVNKLETKQAFIATYWGQNVGVRIIDSNGSLRRGIKVNGTYIEYLELTDMSKITDQYAIEVAKILNMNQHLDKEAQIVWVKDALTLFPWEHTFKKHLEVADFLRSKGYALPYRGIPVPKLIELQYLKLKASLIKS